MAWRRRETPGVNRWIWRSARNRRPPASPGPKPGQGHGRRPRLQAPHQGKQGQHHGVGLDGDQGRGAPNPWLAEAQLQDRGAVRERQGSEQYDHEASGRIVAADPGRSPVAAGAAASAKAAPKCESQAAQAADEGESQVEDVSLGSRSEIERSWRGEQGVDGSTGAGAVRMARHQSVMLMRPRR